ncbi:MAG: bifunctional diguanylate cyclase/phosphodiesterase [Gammaproteobacteria bacterium]|nr:bifunctional diguanylate cyclase/phosphodiesterase [Gammaproteobacteria bacterium]MBU1415043.1 bifunctional diguanylate cyclase/phosphodiesterase [Gammaproteobacteria bacterium]
MLLGAAWLTAWGWRHQAENAVIDRELQRSIAVATGLSNVLLPRYTTDLRRVTGKRVDAARNLEFLDALREDVSKQVQGQRVARVEILDSLGAVVFSTENGEVGRNRSGDPGVTSALAGEAHARMTHGNRAGVIMEADAGGGRDLVQAYVPAGLGVAERQDAVFGVYTDVSEAMSGVREEAHTIWAIANLAGLTVFGVALMILRRAEEAQRRKDSITGLPGRENALAVMSDAQRRAGTDTSIHIGWLIVGVQRLRQVSAAYGHQAADEVLRQTSLRLQEMSGAEPRLFRLGGEAFALLIVEPETGTSDGELAERLSREVMERFVAPLECEGNSVVADLAIGVALSRVGNANPEELMNQAEVSLTEAKRRGSGRWLLYVPGLEQGVRDRLQSVGGLREAFERKQFRVYYQPLVDAHGRAWIGCEALVRWKHPVKGIVLPDSFIPLLEETGLIIEVGLFVLREACRQTVAWRARFNPEFTVSVNLSARQFTDPNLLANIREVLDDTKLPATALTIEVTETFLAMEPEYAAGVLADLRKLGVAVAIDDFGVGYSSLSSLRRLPVNVLKIDRSFVIQAPHDPVDASIAQAVAALARGLNLTLVAEGVETEAQAEFSRSIGCDKLQGYLYARPLDVADFEARFPRSGNEEQGARAAQG